MRFRGLVYRAHDPRWYWPPVSGEGARLHGGRFNRVGVAALYTSLQPGTAMREASVIGMPMQPVLVCAYDVDSKPIFDAADPSQRAALGIAGQDLRCPTWEREMREGQVPASQIVADRLISAGYAGMIAPAYYRAAGPEERNLVLWRWGDELPSRVRLVDDEGRLTPE